MDAKLCPGIQTAAPPFKILPPSFRESPPPIQSRNFSNPPFLKFWLESQPPPFRKGVVPTIQGVYFLEKYDEQSKSVAFGEKLRYFTDQNGTK